jgi:signal transduction histidine kinase
LYIVKLYAEAATRRMAAGDTATAATYLGELRTTAQDAVQDLRQVIYELRPPILEQEGLVVAIQERLEAVEGRAGLETEFVVEGEHPLPATVEQALYRIAQETLNNALKYAKAHRISVVLQQASPQTRLTIMDDGVGCEPAAATAHGGLGLRGIAERVAHLGGRLTVDSNPGQGTVIEVEVPI